MENVSICRISDPGDPSLARMEDWLMGWWGTEQGFSRAKMRSYLVHSLCEGRLPETFALYLGGDLAGMYQLSVTDIDVRPDIYPWLINVYVAPLFRGRGLLGCILDSARENAAALGYARLHLFTKYDSLYERYGWEFVEAFQTFITEEDVQRLYRLKL